MLTAIHMQLGNFVPHGFCSASRAQKTSHVKRVCEHLMILKLDHSLIWNIDLLGVNHGYCFLKQPISILDADPSRLRQLRPENDR